MNVVLASASPRRRELLRLLGLPFRVVPSRYVEPPLPREPIALSEYAQAQAVCKARDVALMTEAGFVVGADTIVTLDRGEPGIAIGKPSDASEARIMLRHLSGVTHYVCTGVAVVPVVDGAIKAPISAADRTAVRFRDLTDRMIADYVATGEPLDKAGAYGAQGYAAPFIEAIEGDFFSVVGLPLPLLGRLLESAGLEWWRHRVAMPAIIG